MNDSCVMTHDDFHPSFDSICMMSHAQIKLKPSNLCVFQAREHHTTRAAHSTREAQEPGGSAKTWMQRMQSRGRLRIIPSPQDMCRTSELAFIVENCFMLIFADSPLRWDKALEGRMRSMSAEYGWPADVNMSRHQVAIWLQKHPLDARLFASNRRGICAYKSSLCRQDA